MCQTLYWVEKANGVQNIKTCGPHSHLEHLDSLVSAYEELNRHKGFHGLQLNCIFATLSSPDDPWSAKIEDQEHEKEGVRNYVPYSALLSICNTPLMPKCAKVRNCNNTKNPPFPGFAALAKCSHPDVKQPQQLIFSFFFLFVMAPFWDKTSGMMTPTQLLWNEADEDKDKKRMKDVAGLSLLLTAEHQ